MRSIREKDATRSIYSNVNVHVDLLHIYAECAHKPIGKVWYLEDEATGAFVAMASSQENIALRDGGKKAMIRSRRVQNPELALELEIRCCPPKVLQKHNLFGHNDVQDYAHSILELVTRRLGIEVQSSDRCSWLKGNIRITEIHLTANFHCPNGMSIPIIQAIDENFMEGKIRKKPSLITLDRGKERSSTFHSIVIYDKYIEMMLHKELKAPNPVLAALLREAKRGLRVELQLRSHGLKYHKLNKVCLWNDISVAELYFKYLDRLNLQCVIQPLLTEDELSILSRAEKRAYKLWLKGVDIDEQFGRTNSWAITKRIYDKIGISVAGKRRPEKLPEIDLAMMFVPDNVLPIPEWAYGTSSYSPPGEYLASVLEDEMLIG